MPLPDGDDPTPAVLAPALARTNQLRKVHNASELTWDAELAASAEEWAQTCSMAQSWTPGVGENLAYGYKGWDEAVDAWYREVRLGPSGEGGGGRALAAGM
jgi:uncharacterized protein YkwD